VQAQVSKPMARSSCLSQSHAVLCLDNAFRFIDGMTAVWLGWCYPTLRQRKGEGWGTDL